MVLGTIIIKKKLVWVIWTTMLQCTLLLESEQKKLAKSVFYDGSISK